MTQPAAVAYLTMHDTWIGTMLKGGWYHMMQTGWVSVNGSVQK